VSGKNLNTILQEKGHPDTVLKAMDIENEIVKVRRNSDKLKQKIEKIE
jgi:hypothetical protein